MEEFFTAIANFGFPVAVAGYLLFRFENKLEKLEGSISGKDGLIVTIKSFMMEVKELRREIRDTRKVNGK